jgi:L-ascorbate metabolism protein UlaG (beta-lactamase superfamily)
MSKSLSRIAGCCALFVCMLAAPLALAAQSGGKIELLWLAQSATRITSVNGKVILIDPWLTKNPKTPEQYKNLDAIGKVDIILVTHAHGDHLGDAVDIAKKQNVPMWGPAGMNQALLTIGALPEALVPRMNKSGTINPFPGVKITQTHAEHSSELVWPNAQGKPETLVGGQPVGYIIELENGFKIYHMGDTGLFSDMKFIADYYKPDLVMIPIGGHYVMSPKDAAFATKQWLKPKYAIPMHYGTNPFLKGTPKEYMDALGKTKTKVFPINPGDKLTF